MQIKPNVKANTSIIKFAMAYYIVTSVVSYNKAIFFSEIENFYRNFFLLAHKIILHF